MHGPWTFAVLETIVNRPATRAAELAAAFGRDLQPFKTDVRKLKNLGLTLSLERGYRLSPRGEAYYRRRISPPLSADSLRRERCSDIRVGLRGARERQPGGRGSAMPGDGSIQEQLTKTVVAGSLAPLVVAVAGVVAVVAFGHNVAGAVVIIVVALLAAVVVLRPGMRRVRTLKARFERANRLAAEAATVRLPEALDLALDGGKVTDRQLPLLPDEHDELGELIAALDRTLRTAITVASEQARVRRQAGDMFVDLGRRHQALLSRSLELVTELERRDAIRAPWPTFCASTISSPACAATPRASWCSQARNRGAPARTPKPSRPSCAPRFLEIEAFDRVDVEKLEPERVSSVVRPVRWRTSSPNCSRTRPPSPHPTRGFRSPACTAPTGTYSP